MPVAAGNSEEMLPFLEEGFVEGVIAAGGNEAVELPFIEEMESGVFVELEGGGVRFGGVGEGFAEFVDDGGEFVDDAEDVGARGGGGVDAEAPDGFAGFEVGAEGEFFEVDAFGEEGVAVGEMGDGLEEGAVGASEISHA